MNFSFSDFYHFARIDLTKEATTLPIKNIIHAMMSKNAQFVFNKVIHCLEVYNLYINLKDTINITSFLLCFCCEEIVFWIYDSLINEFKMQELFKQENDFFEKEIAFIKNLGNVFKIFSEENEKNIQKFLEETLPKFFKSLFLMN